MLSRSRRAGRWVAGAALLLTIWLTVQVGVALAAPNSMVGVPELAQVLPTPTPFRFLTPTPFVPGATTTTTRPATAPNAGGFPLELAFPILAGGLAAIGGGSLVLRRKTTR
ncbi:MAG TPA: hypothetical protein VGJ60_12035 [Chloroflexota bacterium]|jgi:hypothetical protein